jgi:hypothetical protein
MYLDLTKTKPVSMCKGPWIDWIKMFFQFQENIEIYIQNTVYFCMNTVDAKSISGLLKKYVVSQQHFSGPGYAREL